MHMATMTFSAVVARKKNFAVRLSTRVIANQHFKGLKQKLDVRSLY